MSGLFAKAAAIAAVIVIWWFLCAIGVILPAAAPSPWRTAQTLDLLKDPAYWDAVLLTLKTWAIGLALAIAIAIPLGMLFGAVDVLYKASRFTIDFLRSVPPVSIIPLAILLYGATVKMAVFMIIFAASWPLLLQTLYGIHEVDPVARDMAASYKLRARQRAFLISLPSAAPFMATGLRLAATFSLLVAVGAGVIGGAPGIGASIVEAEQTGHVPEMFVFILTAGMLGLLINLVMQRIERRVLFWHHAYRGEKTA